MAYIIYGEASVCINPFDELDSCIIFEPLISAYVNKCAPVELSVNRALYRLQMHDY